MAKVRGCVSGLRRICEILGTTKSGKTTRSSLHSNTYRCTHTHTHPTNTGLGRLAQRFTFCLEQEPDLENVVFSTPVRPPGTLYLPTFMTLVIPVDSENDSRVYFLIVLITDYCWPSWTCRIAAPYKYRVD